MTYEPYWRLSASCSRWSETDLKQKPTWERFVSGPYLNICRLPSCLEPPSLTSAIPGVPEGTPRPAPAQKHCSGGEGWLGRSSRRYTQPSPLLSSYDLQKKAQIKEEGAFSLFFSQSFKGKLCKDDNYLFSSRVKVSLKHFWIILMKKHLEHPNWNKTSLFQILERWQWLYCTVLSAGLKGWSRHEGYRHTKAPVAAACLLQFWQQTRFGSAPSARNYRLGKVVQQLNSRKTSLLHVNSFQL